MENSEEITAAMPQRKKSRFTLPGLWRLFLLLALPLHFWSIFIALSDVEGMARRSTVFDAISFVAYVLVIAFAESVFTFIFALMLSLLLPKRWNTTQWVLALASIGYAVAGWTILNQINYWVDFKHGYVLNWLNASNHQLRYGVIVIVLAVSLVILSIIIPLYIIDRSKTKTKILDQFADRLTLLSSFFIVLDLFAGLLVLYRNIK